MSSKWFTVGLLALLAFSGCQSRRPPAPLLRTANWHGEPVARNAAEANPEFRQVGFQETVTESADEAAADELRPNPTLDEIEQRALAVSPVLAKLQADIDALRGKRTQASLPPNPKVGINAEDINDGGGAGRYGVFFGQEVVRGNKLGLSRSVVCAEIQTAQQRLQAARQQLVNDVRKRYYDLLVAQDRARVAGELVQISQNAVDVSKQLFEAEEVARIAVLQTELELQSAQAIQRRADNAKLAARRSLAALLAETELPPGDLDGDPRHVTALIDFEEAFDLLVEQSPEIAVLFADVERAKRKLARECAEPIPNATWQASMQYDFVSDDVVSGLQVGMPIPIRNRNQGAIQQARFQIVAAERKVESAVMDLRSRLSVAFQNYRDAKIQVETYQSKILPKAKETYALVAKGYQEGEVDFLQLLTIQRTYSGDNLDYLEKLQQLWRKHVEIEGMLVTGMLP